jgi:hypothetical protein
VAAEFWVCFAYTCVQANDDENEEMWLDLQALSWLQSHRMQPFTSQAEVMLQLM